MTSAEKAVRQITALLPSVRGGSLCFFGEWFGGRPDNWHVITGAEPDGDALAVRFNEGETLTIWDPEGVTISEDEFRIERASRLRWEWFYYGRPRRPENLYLMEYVVAAGGVTVRDTSDWFEPQHNPDLTAPAVEIG